jgi:hypothetical protein
MRGSSTVEAVAAAIPWGLFRAWLGLNRNRPYQGAMRLRMERGSHLAFGEVTDVVLRYVEVPRKSPSAFQRLLVQHARQRSISRGTGQQ